VTVTWTEDTVTAHPDWYCGDFEISSEFDSDDSTFNPEGDSTYDATKNSVA